MHLKSHWKQPNDCDGLLIKANILIWWNDKKKACPSITWSTNVNMAAIFWLLQNVLITIGNLKTVNWWHLGESTFGVWVCVIFFL